MRKDSFNRQLAKAIPAIIAFIVIVVAEVLMYTTAMLDGKYCLTESNYYLHVNSLAICLLISNLVMAILFILLIRAKRDLGNKSRE